VSCRYNGHLLHCTRLNGKRYVRVWRPSVRLSVCPVDVPVLTVTHQGQHKLIEMQFGEMVRVGARTLVLDGVQIFQGKSAILRVAWSIKNKGNRCLSRPAHIRGRTLTLYACVIMTCLHARKCHLEVALILFPILGVKSPKPILGVCSYF